MVICEQGRAQAMATHKGQKAIILCKAQSQQIRWESMGLQLQEARLLETQAGTPRAALVAQSKAHLLMPVIQWIKTLLFSFSFNTVSAPGHGELVSILSAASDLSRLRAPSA